MYSQTHVMKTSAEYLKIALCFVVYTHKVQQIEYKAVQTCSLKKYIVLTCIS